MDREEILAKSRKDFKDKDELTLDILAKAGKKSSQVGLLVTSVIIAGDQFLFNTYNFAAQAIYFAITATMTLIRYKYNRERKDLTIGVIFVIGAVLSLIAHFIRFK